MTRSSLAKTPPDRFAGIRRDYAPHDVERLRGSLRLRYSLAEQGTARLERQQVQRCLKGLTDLQREAITLAYYRGYSYREVAQLLGAALPTIKTRMRDGLIRLRDCLESNR